MMSLGCPKTLVDSEVILGKLDAQKYSIVPSVENCEIALLNTCSFIRDAQEESVDRIMELIELKKDNRIAAIVVMGCLVQQFPKDLQSELKEVDAFIGSGEYQKIPEIIENVKSGKHVYTVGNAGYLSTSLENRVSLTPNYYRYLKISEGCDHICSFCTIPSFRGKHRSRTIEDVVAEAKNLVKQGAKEIILTGQDTTYFGRDQSDQFLLPELLYALDSVEGVEWIRVLYAYPSCLPTELMEAMRDTKKVCHYLDMPLQHASDAMLLAMRRGITKRRTKDLIKKFRTIVSDLAIRTTFIVGFPGETEKDFEELLEFIEEMKFDRAGVFKYSTEAGSHAASLPNLVDEKTKDARFEKIMLLQQRISRENNQKWVGKNLKVLVEGHDPVRGEWKGRSYMDAPEIDGNVLIHTDQPLYIGDFANIKITEAQEYDLVGTLALH